MTPTHSTTERTPHMRDASRHCVCIAALLIGIVILCGCKRGTPPTPPRPSSSPSVPTKTSAPTTIRFTDITRSTGIDMMTKSGESPSTQILEVNGTGLALFDYDNDNDLDLFIANGATLDDTEHGPGCRLYQNQLIESGELRFTNATESAGIIVTRWTMGVAAADVNGDGFDDLYLTCFGPNILLMNNGDGTFTDNTANAGVGDNRWGTTAAFGDFDQDNDLDLYVVNYLEFNPASPPRRDSFQDIAVMGGPHGLRPQADILYRNNGDGTFTAPSLDELIANPPAPSYGLNAVTIDVDGDGRQDIIVGNDSMPNFYFRNITEPGGPIRFEEKGLISGLSGNGDGMPQATMGMAIGDVNHDGRPDLFSSNFSSDTNTLHVNIEGRMFDDHTTRYGFGMTTRPFLGWGSVFADFDHDGDEDLLVVNGHVYPEATRESMGSDYEQPPLFYQRADGQNRFNRMQPTDTNNHWLNQPHRDRALAIGDLDNDGDLDAVVIELNGPVRVLRNDIIRKETVIPAKAGTQSMTTSTSESKTGLIIKLHDNRPESKNPRGIGSKVQLHLPGQTLTRWLTSGGAFQSSHAPKIHFGLPLNSSGHFQITITWPDGHTQTFTPPTPPANQLTITRE